MFLPVPWQTGDVRTLFITRVIFPSGTPISPPLRILPTVRARSFPPRRATYSASCSRTPSVISGCASSLHRRWTVFLLRSIVPSRVTISP